MKQLFLRRLCSTALLSFFSIAASAQGFQLQWANVLTGTGTVTTGPLAVDGSGNVYVPGSFAGTVDFDPGAGVTSLTSDTAFGKGVYFLAKYNAQGGLVYVRQLGISVRAITRDSNGDLYITGSFSGTKDFDPGIGTASLTSTGTSANIYVAKYDASGAYINAFAIGGGTVHDVNAITADPSGNIYITGRFGGTVDFDPGAGIVPLVSNGTGDIFLAKYSSAGALHYAFRLNGTTSGTEEGVSLAADASGVYLGGRFNGTVDIDPGPGTVSLSSNGADGFVAKYDPSGAFIFGNNYDGNVYALAQDASNNIWVTGSIPDSMDADLGPGRAMLYGANNFDVYLVKYSSAGTYLHGRAFQSDSLYNPEEGMAVNQKGSAYIYGRYRGTVDFNPGGSGGSITTSGALDNYVVKYNAGGSFVTGFSIGNNNNSERVAGMAIDKLGRIWISGNFSGSLDLDPGAGTSTVTSTPNTGGYIALYNDDETETASGIGSSTTASPSVKVYGGDNTVFVDFNALDKVDARIKVLNMMGQTVAEATHARNDMLQLPDAAAQVYVVVVSSAGAVAAKKVWVK